MIYFAFKGLISKLPPDNFDEGDVMQNQSFAVPSACQIFGIVSLWKKKLHNFGFHGLNRRELGQIVRTEFWIDCHPKGRVAFGR